MSPALFPDYHTQFLYSCLQRPIVCLILSIRSKFRIQMNSEFRISSLTKSPQSCLFFFVYNIPRQRIHHRQITIAGAINDGRSEAVVGAIAWAAWQFFHPSVTEEAEKTEEGFNSMMHLLYLSLFKKHTVHGLYVYMYIYIYHLHNDICCVGHLWTVCICCMPQMPRRVPLPRRRRKICPSTA